MSSARERGNDYFRRGEHAAALEAYTQGLTGPPRIDAKERALLLCNRAACSLALGQTAGAAADCRACLEIEPANFKAHFRLAKSLPPGDEAAAPAIAAAVALAGPENRTPMLDTYTAIRTATEVLREQQRRQQQQQDGTAPAAGGDAGAAGAATAGVVLLALPTAVEQIAVAGTWGEVEAAVALGKQLVVLRPGRYRTSIAAPGGAGGGMMPGLFGMMGLMRGRGGGGGSSKGAGYTLLGVGAVELYSPPGAGHALWVTEDHPPVTLVGMRLVGGGRAAVCLSAPEAAVQAAAASEVEPEPQLTMSWCRVVDYDEVGVLVVGPVAARLDRCVFARNAKQAVEVREGGSLAGHRLAIADCRQGVSAYGGARRLVLTDSLILRALSEGLLLAGGHSNAATAAQLEMLGGDKPPPWATGLGADIFRTADEQAKELGSRLSARVEGCVVAGCGQFGVSADSGTQLLLRRCRLLGNDPIQLFIKGCSDVTVLCCQLSYSGAMSRCEWYSRTGLPSSSPMRRQCGVRVGVNYGAWVRLEGCAFAGPDPADLAIFEEMHGRGAQIAGTNTGPGAARLGMWSRPVSAARNSFHAASLGAAAAKAASSKSRFPGDAEVEGSAVKEEEGDEDEGGRAGEGFGEEERLPSLKALAARLPAWALDSAASGIGGSGVPTASGAALRAFPPPAMLQRTGFTFPQSAWSPTAHQFYAIGNTFGYDVTGGLLQPPPAPPSVVPAGDDVNTAGGGGGGGDVHVLLGGCGDIRNLLATAHAVLGSSSGSSVRRLTMTLNDGNLAMLARNVVLLHMAAEQRAAPAAVLAAWANHGLSAAHAHLVRCSLRALADEPWPHWLSAAEELVEPNGKGDGSSSDAGAGADGSSSSTARELRRAFAAWADCTLSLEALMRMRADRRGLDGGGSGQASEAAVELSLAAVAAQLGAAVAARLKPEVAEYVRAGSLRMPAGDVLGGGGRAGAGGVGAGGGRGAVEVTEANPTLLLAPELQYTVYFSSSILRAVALKPGSASAAAAGSAATGRLAPLLLEALAPQLQAVVEGLSGGRLRVRLQRGDILAALLSAPTPGPGAHGGSGGGYFDFIDCSNVADYVSLPALLAAAAPLLKPPAATAQQQQQQQQHPGSPALLGNSRLRCESIVVYGAECVQQKLQRALGKAAGGSGSSSKAPTPAAFVAGQLGGMSLAAFCEASGMRLCGGQQLEGRPDTPALRLEWAAEAAATAVAAEPVPEAGSSSSSSSWLTAPRLLLELLPVCRQLLVAPTSGGGVPVAPSPLALVQLAALAAPPAALEPLVRALVRCDASGVAGLFKWELQLHAALQAAAAAAAAAASTGAAETEAVAGTAQQGQAQRRSAASAVRWLEYAADPGWDLAGRDDDPLLLAFSRKPLPRGVSLSLQQALGLQADTAIAAGGAGGGGGRGPAVAAAAAAVVKQLVAGFSWDEAQGVAHVVLPAAITEQCGSWFVTLCSLGSSSKGAGPAGKAAAGSSSDSALTAVGASKMVLALKEVEGAAAPKAPVVWRRRRWAAAADVGSGESGTAGEDVALLERATAAAASANGGGGGGGVPVSGGAPQWQAAMRLCTRSVGAPSNTGGGGSGSSSGSAWRRQQCVAVDLLAPSAPLPAADRLCVDMAVEGCELVVRLKPLAPAAGGASGKAAGKGGKAKGKAAAGGAGGAAASGEEAADSAGGSGSSIDEFRLQLPALGPGRAYSGRVEEVRLSRRLGLLCALVPVE